MNKAIKLTISIFLGLFSVMALADILSGGEPLIDETIIIFISLSWFWFLMKKVTPPKFLIAFYIFLALSVLHNLVSFQLKTEEPVFFTLALISLLISGILLVKVISEKILLKRHRKTDNS